MRLGFSALRRAFLIAALGFPSLALGTDPPTPPTEEGNLLLRDFRFQSGESLPALTLHYTTLGKPRYDAGGHVANAVLILHGTGGDGHQFLRPQFAGVLFRPGGLLDPAQYYVILPDDIGHGKSSKPSDGLHARFPQYDYHDMVTAEHALVAGLGVDRLRLVLGTSMGCMHSFLWGETYPHMMDALMPLACLTVEIAGRNRLWRDMIIDQIRSDPAWAGGEYKTEPAAALRGALDILMLAGSAPLQMQAKYPTRAAADAYLSDYLKRETAMTDANDLLYQVAASRDYDPSPDLGRITVPVMWVNSADDFINPPELGIAEREVKKIGKGRFVLIPVGPDTHGHGTHTWAALWERYLAELMVRSQPKP